MSESECACLNGNRNVYNHDPDGTPRGRCSGWYFNTPTIRPPATAGKPGESAAAARAARLFVAEHPAHDLEAVEGTFARARRMFPREG